jgi:antitoxin component of MazEF toxin-antitoxin module
MMNATQTTAIEAGNRIQLPAEWAEALGLRDQVVLVKTDAGILVRPQPRATWDDIFASKLSVKPGDRAESLESAEVSGDDLLF